ncbi:MAG: hypothetical protein ACJ8AH_11245 [Stellaceae bacterium]|jgi:hypothetical protein
MKTSKAGTTIVAASVLLAACAAPGGTTVPQTTKVSFYPQCYQSVALLRQQDQQFQQAMAVNTLTGAAGGAALGALVSGGDWRGALIGAATGAAVAATATYASARAQEADDEQRRLLIANDMSHDYGEVQRAVVAARQADNCYGYAYNELVANLRRGAISKPDAAQRFAEIDQGERELAAILGEYGKKTSASVQQYEVAFNNEAQRLNTTPSVLVADAGAPPPPSATRAAPAPRPAAPISQNTRQLAQNYSRLNQQVSEINQEQSTIERTASARRNDMQSLGVAVQS